MVATPGVSAETVPSDVPLIGTTVATAVGSDVQLIVAGTLFPNLSVVVAPTVVLVSDSTDPDGALTVIAESVPAPARELCNVMASLVNPDPLSAPAT